MMTKQPLNDKEIISLLSKLKDETPEYPVDLLEARKVAFLKQAGTMNLPDQGKGGEGEQGSGTSGSGGSGAGMGGTAAQGFILQALIGFSIVAALLLTAFAYRDRISEILRENGGVAVEQPLIAGQPLATSAGSTPAVIATVSPLASTSPTQPVPVTTGTMTAGEDDTTLLNSLGLGVSSNDTKTNPGLHLGQTPGMPAAPGQGNPGNINQPDKPDKPEKPDKPDNPNKPEKGPK